MALLWTGLRTWAAWDYQPDDEPAHILPVHRVGYTAHKPVEEVPAVLDFMMEHGPDDSRIWQRHGAFGPIDLTGPVYATQSHVSRKHLDKYGPGEVREHDPTPAFSQWEPYLGNDGPMVVTHRGAHYVLDGHHRVGAALERGEPKVDAWHLDLDSMKGSERR